jgi:hypothetical protein
MLKHLSFTKLADLAEGRLTADERNLSSAHVSSCSRCAAELTRLENILGLMRTDEAEDAPREVVSRAINLFRSRAVSQVPSVIQRIAAALSFDSFQMSPAYGVRSGQAAPARQLLYNAGEYDLDLRLSETSEGWIVAGQLLGQECATGGHVELTGTQDVVQAELNEQCEFNLSAVPTGNYKLSLRLTDLEVEIPELELKA